jgi:hypothetical protein
MKHSEFLALGILFKTLHSLHQIHQFYGTNNTNKKKHMKNALEQERQILRERLERILTQYPTLGRWGFENRRLCIKRSSVEELADHRLQLRNALEEIELAGTFLLGIQVKDHLRKNQEISSYSLKDLAELWFDLRGEAVYIANGSMTVALLLLEIPCELINDTPNAYVGIDKRWYYNLMLEIDDRRRERPIRGSLNS